MATFAVLVLITFEVCLFKQKKRVNQFKLDYGPINIVFNNAGYGLTGE